MATISGEQSCGSAINVSAKVGVVLNSCTRQGNSVVLSINPYLYQSSDVWSSNSWSIFVNGTEYTVFECSSGSKHTTQNTKYYAGNISLTIESSSTTISFTVGVNGLSWNPSAAHTNFTFTVSDVTPAESIITYNANGGSGAPSELKKPYGTAVKLSTTKPNRSGYSFVGWCMSPERLGTIYSGGSSFTQDVSVTLFAVWDRIPQVTVKNNSSWSETEMIVKSGNSWVNAPNINIL